MSSAMAKRMLGREAAALRPVRASAPSRSAAFTRSDYRGSPQQRDNCGWERRTGFAHNAKQAYQTNKERVKRQISQRVNNCVAVRSNDGVPAVRWPGTVHSPSRASRVEGAYDAVCILRPFRAGWAAATSGAVGCS